MRYADLLREGRKRLQEHGDQAAGLLLNEICRGHDINLYMVMEEPMPEDLQTEYLEGVHRMERGEPLDYVLGYTPFYGYDFLVSPDVLIPRPETEELVALVLRLYDEYFPKQKVTVFDVGTGSGAIGISLALEEPDFTVYASDISEQAVRQAETNRDRLQAGVSFLTGSLLEPYIQAGLHCDILVCNPPYIPSQEQIERSVRDFEPHVALFGGPDGLKFYRALFATARQVLKPEALMAFEMGWSQGQALTDLAHEYFPEAVAHIEQDINGKDRMFWLHIGAENPAAGEGQVRDENE